MKIGILISGRGSNMATIIKAVKRGGIPDSEVAIVISDRAKAAGLEKAKADGVDTLVVERKRRARSVHDAEIVSELNRRKVELVCLAGYMRLLSGDFVKAFPSRIINIHPSLLPSFKGLNAHQQAIEYGAKISGCTVHFVDEELDHGAIIFQTAVEIKDDDDAQALSNKILRYEHATYVESIRRIVVGEIEIDGRRVIRNIPDPIEP